MTERIVKYHGLAKRIAGLWSYRTGMEYEELLAPAEDALMWCDERYAEGSKASFKTYATNRINGAIQDHIRKVTGVRTREGVGKSRRKLDFVTHVSSLDAEIPSEREIVETLHDRIEDARVDLHRSAEFSLVLERVAALPDRERLIVSRLMAGYTLREIGEELGITESRVSQISSRTVARLRERLAA